MKVKDLTDKQIAAAMSSRRATWESDEEWLWDEFYHGRTGYQHFTHEDLLEDLNENFCSFVEENLPDEITDETEITGNPVLEKFFSKDNIDHP